MVIEKLSWVLYMFPFCIFKCFVLILQWTFFYVSVTEGSEN